MNKVNILTVISIIVILGFVVFAWSSLSNNQDSVTDPSSTPTQLASDKSTPTRTPIQDDNNKESPIPSGWNTHVSSEHNFTISYPADLIVEERTRDAIRFTKFGPTQEENTEFYDGISISFNSGDLNNQNLQDFVENVHSDMKNEPVTESISSIDSIKINEYQGYKFTSQSLGESTHIYLPQGDNSYLYIIDSTVDPTNEGFAETVNRMLSTLEIIT